MSLAINFDDIQLAAQRIKGVANRTPVLTSRTANGQAGAELFFKCENYQRMGAFKFRGAYNALAQFTPEQRKAGVCAFSSGNHAQGIALSAQLLGIPAAIVMPLDSPAIKLAATRGYGAEVITYDRYKDDREALAKQLSQERGMTLIPPYDHAHVMAGQGTAALELLEEVGQLDTLLVCLGGGGLISGCAVAAKHLNPKIRVIGVEPVAGNDAQQSKRAGKIIKINTPKTIADGAQTQFVGQLTFPVIQELVDDIVTVSDAQLIEAMRFAAGRMKMVIEPTGGLAMAAAMQGAVDVKGQRVGVIISGGNVDIAQLAKYLA
ncbi:MAG: threo-3-hydroxy-L-aspartate ammonia-lyase [Burkholderiales bacterium]|nr:MAG: threo-3-hydroxy-L-aspartate ammonia-lyase [Burkholderiales bacterium]